MTTEIQSVAESLQQERQKKKERIAGSLWPRARLVGEILFNEIMRDRTFSQAAALTYKTLFSLLPVFVLSLLVLSTISSGDGTALDKTMEETVFKQLSIDKLELKTADNKPVMDAEGKPVTARQLIMPLLARAKEAVTRPTTGIIAFGILLYGSISLMVVIESTFNLIYGAVKPRSWPRRIMLYWCVLTLGPVGLAASILIGRMAYSTATGLTGNWMIAPTNIAAGFLLSWTLSLVMFKLIPDTRVSWKSAFIGSAVAALLWECCKWGFSVYVNRALKSSWYGSLVLIPLFMMWIYLTWSAILLGLQVAYVHQFFPLLRRRFYFTRRGAAVVSDVRWVLALGVLLYRRFQEGKGLHPYEAAELLMVPNDAAGQLLEGLETAGIVHTTKHETYALARSSESITAYDLLTAARALCQVPPEIAREKPLVGSYPESPALMELEELERRWGMGQTLAHLAKGAGGQEVKSSKVKSSKG
jgi:membrane protein